MKILAVDDDELNLEVLAMCLDRARFTSLLASNAEEALKILNDNPDIKAILLDKMLPDMCGVALLQRIRNTPEIAHIPVIMQTASTETTSVIECIKAGAYYYLTKPFDQEILLSILEAALQDSESVSQIPNIARENKLTLGLIKHASFEYKTVEQSKNLALFLSNGYDDPERALLGLIELLVNAVEHGNLGIGFEAKGQLLREGKLAEERDKRLLLPENQHKRVEVSFKNTEHSHQLWIKDEGKGFDWNSFMTLQPERATCPNGRGIMMAKELSFDRIEYANGGTEVYATVFKEESSEQLKVS